MHDGGVCVLVGQIKGIYLSDIGRYCMLTVEGDASELEKKNTRNCL